MTARVRPNFDRRDPEPSASLHSTTCKESGPVPGDRRESAREPVSGPLWWKGQDDDLFQQGWLIERSSDSAAFLARGRVTPLQGTRLKVSTSDPTDVGFRVEEGLVTRTHHVHADLFLVAAQLKPSHA